MDELIVKLLKGEATDFEIRQLERWRATSPEHDSEFQEIERLWTRASAVTEPDVPPPPPIAEILEQGNRRRKQAEVRKSVRKLILSPALAFGLTAAAVAALIFSGLRNPGEPEPRETALSPVETFSGTGDITTLGLSDGSVIRMASDSRIEFPPGSEERRVGLEGKAFFAVSSGEVPFVVRTRLGEVTVRGTRFEVFVDEGELRVIVVEGMVDVEGAGGRLRVGPGQIAYLPSAGPPRVQEGADLETLLSWPGGLLIFQETPFADVAGEVAEHFGVAFDLPDPELAARRITAWFGDEPLDEVVSALCLVAGVRCELGDNRVIIDP